jgi:hypothetical protein
MTGYPKGRPWYVVIEIVFCFISEIRGGAVSSRGALKWLTTGSGHSDPVNVIYAKRKASM